MMIDHNDENVDSKVKSVILTPIEVKNITVPPFCLGIVIQVYMLRSMCAVTYYAHGP